LSQEQFNNFLPGGTALNELVAAVKTYVGEEKAWDLQLVLKHSDVPATRLGRNVRVGLTTWMGQRQGHSDADEVILKPVG
ncbi:MAG: type VI secretion system baseplate subunit TssG, partial [Rhodanobacter sp.]